MYILAPVSLRRKKKNLRASLLFIALFHDKPFLTTSFSPSGSSPQPVATVLDAVQVAPAPTTNWPRRVWSRFRSPSHSSPSTTTATAPTKHKSQQRKKPRNQKDMGGARLLDADGRADGPLHRSTTATPVAAVTAEKNRRVEHLPTRSRTTRILTSNEQQVNNNKEHQPQNRALIARLTQPTLRNVLKRLVATWSRGQSRKLHRTLDYGVDLHNVRARRLTLDAALNINSLVNEGLDVKRSSLLLTALQVSGGSFRARNVAYHVGRGVVPPFGLQADRVRFTSTDLMASPAIRNGVRRLLTRLLHQRQMDAVFVAVDDLVVQGDNQVAGSPVLLVKATATTILGQRVPFTLEIEQPCVTQERNNKKRQRSILTLPAVTVRGWPWTWRNVRVDLGPSCRLKSLTCTPDNFLEVTASVVIGATENHRRWDHPVVTPTPGAASAVGTLQVDVGRWLTRRFGFGPESASLSSTRPYNNKSTNEDGDSLHQG